MKITDNSLYEPDVVVRCGERLDGNEVLVPEPVIVVEVLSPSTKNIDSSRKLGGYFGLPSVVHYLLVPTEPDPIVHHRRGADGGILTRLVTGRLELDPPGLVLEIEPLYA